MFVRLLVVALNGTRGHREALFFRRRYEPGASVPRWLHKQIGIEPGGHRKRSESKVPIVFNAIYLWHIMTTCCVNFGEDRWELGRLRCPAARGETEFSVVCGGAPGFMKRGNKGNILYIFNQSWFVQPLDTKPLIWLLPAYFTDSAQFWASICSTFPVDGPDLSGHGTEFWHLNAVSWHRRDLKSSWVLVCWEGTTEVTMWNWKATLRGQKVFPIPGIAKQRRSETINAYVTALLQLLRIHGLMEQASRICSGGFEHIDSFYSARARDTKVGTMWGFGSCYWLSRALAHIGSDTKDSGLCTVGSQWAPWPWLPHAAAVLTGHIWKRSCGFLGRSKVLFFLARGRTMMATVAEGSTVCHEQSLSLLTLVVQWILTPLELL